MGVDGGGNKEIYTVHEVSPLVELGDGGIGNDLIVDVGSDEEEVEEAVVLGVSWHVYDHTVGDRRCEEDGGGVMGEGAVVEAESIAYKEGEGVSAFLDGLFG